MGFVSSPISLPVLIAICLIVSRIQWNPIAPSKTTRHRIKNNNGYHHNSNDQSGLKVESTAAELSSSLCPLSPHGTSYFSDSGVIPLHPPTEGYTTILEYVN